MKALSIRQPWAWAILYAGKDVENRDWPTKFRGEFLVHASKGLTKSEYARFEDMAFMMWLNGVPTIPDTIPEMAELQRGGIVGMARISDVVSSSPSPWFMGEYGFILSGVRPLPFVPCKGALGFFDVPADVMSALRSLAGDLTPDSPSP